ncbi:kinase-like protein [Rhizophagus irregularis]|uniref:Kinase-like protein n=1 Tax=Rhizophagus irregularis TaxID=588596 RepID=A0A2I1GNG6_9GLOM|nr:kinase-like protein [Rhizophagus irregularis]
MHQTPNVLNQYKRQCASNAKCITSPNVLHRYQLQMYYMYYINTNSNVHQTPNVLHQYQHRCASIPMPNILYQQMYYINVHQTSKICHLHISLRSQLEEYYANRLKILGIHCYDHQDLEILPVTIGSGGFASVSAARWNNTSTIFAIKKFVYLTRIADGHQNIIRLYGVTKLDGKEKYSLVLEYAEGGTLRNYLRNSNITFKWEDQLRFAKEIASAILWLHNVKEIIHGDLHPNNILIHKDTIKLVDFGRSLEKGRHGDNTGVYGVIPYMDPKTFTSYKINEKSDIYSLGVIFWELTSRSSPFNFETRHDNVVMLEILKGEREKPIPGTNVKYIELYQKCWEHEPDKRPDIVQVNSALSSIDSSAIFNLEKSEDSKKIDVVHSCQIDHNELCR